jgi:DNA-binding YbaB/EbfC family protein
VKLDPNRIMSQVTELQAKLQEKLDAIEESATAGGGMVTATCNGRGELTGVRIDPEVVDRDDVELLEDLVRAAVNEAQTQARNRAQEELRRLFGPLPIPDGFGGLPL